MANIIEGTTPTIKYTFGSVSVTDITTAYLTIKKSDSVAIERDITTATVGDDYLSWILTQAETLSLGVGKATMMLNWVTSDGVRGASEESYFTVAENHKEEEI